MSLLCGLLVAYLGFKSAYQDFLELKKLTDLDQFEQSTGNFLKIQTRRDTSGSDTEYYPDILYEYSVEGANIWGWRLSYEEKPGTNEYWKERLSGYLIGESVIVYYNPDNPKEAILEKKHDGIMRVVLKFILGTGFVLAGCLLAYLPLGSMGKRLLFERHTTSVRK